jgi:hypothetical protein
LRKVIIGNLDARTPYWKCNQASQDFASPSSTPILQQTIDASESGNLKSVGDVYAVSGCVLSLSISPATMEPKASELKNGRIKSVSLDSSDDANWLCLPPFLLSFAVSVELARKIGVYISHRQTVRGGNNLLFISVATLCVVNFQKKNSMCREKAWSHGWVLLSSAPSSLCPS